VNTSYGAFPSAPTTSAGLVIFQAFIPTYFNKLGLTVNGNFVSKDAQNKAVVYLHYLATSESAKNKESLKLEKILCGLPIETPVESDIEISLEVKELSNSLIRAVISSWPAIGNSSIASFQNNWVIRDGLLTESLDRLNLSVEQRSFDLLLEQAPFTFAIIKYPWMPKVLYTTWN
jgi:hypothetical protein